MNKVFKAAVLANEWHVGQTRKHNKLPYIVHPARVAALVKHVGGDEDMVAAAWLHDVLEDTRCTAQDIEEACGSLVAVYVDWLTNPSKQWPGLIRSERKQMDRVHLSLAPRQVKVIKLCDRLDNLRDMEGAEANFKLLYAGESRALIGEMGASDFALSDAIATECRRLTAEASFVLATAA